MNKSDQILDELREITTVVQLKLNLDDNKWRELFDNNEGLYGFVLPLLQQAKSQGAREARIDEVKRAIEWFENESGYLFYLDDRIKELSNGE